MGDVGVVLPNNWNPRIYQVPAWVYLQNGGKRAVLRWHRRAGKDDIALHWAAVSSQDKVGNYWHMLPEYSQARKALWDSVDPHTGKKRIDIAFPHEMRRKTRNDEMFIEFLNGSTWQVVGSDRYDSLVGAPPVGLVFSEYALADPASWDYLRPMLMENGGWAIFVSTVRGRNHFWKLGEYAKSDPAWFFSEVDANQSGVFTAEQLQHELDELVAIKGMDEAKLQWLQEYFNDPSAGLPGAYYASVISQMEKRGQITAVPYDPRFRVTVAWDLGFGDSTSLWFCQTVGRENRVFDYYEGHGVGLQHYVDVLSKRGYVYYRHILPHDADHGNVQTGMTSTQILKSLGLSNLSVLSSIPVDDGINAVRMFLPACVIDAKRCERGLDALRAYHREWDEETKSYSRKPVHDWTSHPADAFRYLSVGYHVPLDEDLGKHKSMRVVEASGVGAVNF